MLRVTSFARSLELRVGLQKLREDLPGLHPTKKPLDDLDHTLYTQRLEALRRANQQGNPGALMQAAIVSRYRDFDRFSLPDPGQLGRGRIVHFASEDHWIEIPLWVYNGLMTVYRDHLRQLHSGKGRTSRWESGYREDLARLVRWTTVQDIREHPEDYGCEASKRDTTPEAVWERAARELEGTGWYASTGMIRKSCRRVNEELQMDPLRFILCLFVGTKSPT